MRLSVTWVLSRFAHSALVILGGVLPPKMPLLLTSLLFLSELSTV
jgi:hypothetical protein